MSILLIDFEATGVEPREARTLEIGAMLTDEKFERIAPAFSQLVYQHDYPELTEEVAKVTGLSLELLQRESLPPVPAYRSFCDWVSKSSTEPINYIIAYNKAYDENLYKEEMGRLCMADPVTMYLRNKPWLCAARDVEKFPAQMKKMMYLALDCGVAVDPKKLHRAVNDVELMRQILQATSVSVDEMYAYSQVPWVVLQAVVSFDRKDEAKKLGYQWEVLRTENGELKYTKSWVKRIKETKLEDEKKLATFEIKIL